MDQVACRNYARTKEIVSEMTTESSVGDGKTFPVVISQISGRPKNVIGDGTYDDKDVWDLIK